MGKLPNDVAIRVHNVHKDFYLSSGDDSIKHRVITALQKKEKLDDGINHALRGVSFDIKKGEFFGIVGRNGSGKSTLLKIISKIYQPSSGTADYNGKLVAFIELGVGFNPQLSGKDNVYLNGAMLGFSRSEIDAMYEEIVEFAELERFMDLDLKNYSSGMKVRLAFSVAIRAQADILVLDEVLAVGDADFQRKCYDYFQNLKDDHKTIVLVSHSMGLVKEYCDKAILIENGKVAYDGTADQVADEYLKLFSKTSANKSGKSGADDRWGDLSVFMDRFEVKVDEDTVNLNVTLKSSVEAVEGVKFGFQIKDRSGRVIAGANNLNVDGGKKLNFTKHDKKELHFAIQNIFGNNTYSVSATVNSHNGSNVCDQWNDITSFSTTKDQAFYPIVCPAKLDIISKS